jgi:hypothetical protein
MSRWSPSSAAPASHRDDQPLEHVAQPVTARKQPRGGGVAADLQPDLLGSVLMAAALPEAFGERGLLFAASYPPR